MGLFCLPYELLCGDFIELFLLGKGVMHLGYFLWSWIYHLGWGFLHWGLGVFALWVGGIFVCVCLFGGVAVSCQVFKALKLVPIVLTGWLGVINL